MPVDEIIPFYQTTRLINGDTNINTVSSGTNTCYVLIWYDDLVVKDIQEVSGVISTKYNMFVAETSEEIEVKITELGLDRTDWDTNNPVDQ